MAHISIMMAPISIMKIAMVAHEANRAYCEALDDHSQKAWNDAPQWQRDSVVSGVKFHIDNPEAGPKASHDAWLAQKEKDGWTYGPVKDEARKQHPCYVPFDELPREQQAKDFIFRAIVHVMAGNRWLYDLS